MKLNELQFNEESVLSSWIEDLSFEGDGVRMELNSGRAYFIKGMDEDMWKAWLFASSKGRFWHGYVKGNYLVGRTI